MSICSKCNALNPEDSRFCSGCGTPLGGSATKPDNLPEMPGSPLAARGTFSPGPASWQGSPVPPPSPGEVITPTPGGWGAGLPGRFLERFKSSHGNLVGEARRVSERTEDKDDMRQQRRSWHIMSFRLERFDRVGNRLQPVQVEMGGWGFKGAIHEGDWIQLTQEPIDGQTIFTDKVYNLTTNAVVEAIVKERNIFSRFFFGLLNLFGYVIGLVVIGIFVFIGIMIIKSLLRSLLQNS